MPPPVNALKGAGPVTFDFTQRGGWSQHIIDESKVHVAPWASVWGSPGANRRTFSLPTTLIQDFLHVLALDSTILFAAPSAQDLTGWSPDELTGCALLD